MTKGGVAAGTATRTAGDRDPALPFPSGTRGKHACRVIMSCNDGGDTDACSDVLVQRFTRAARQAAMAVAPGKDD